MHTHTVQGRSVSALCCMARTHLPSMVVMALLSGCRRAWQTTGLGVCMPCKSPCTSPADSLGAVFTWLHSVSS